MTYNPADNAEVERISKDMPKPELEEYYVRDRNKRHTSCGSVIGTVIAVILLIFVIGAAGWSLGHEYYIDTVEDNMAEISIEVCPFLGQGYVSEQVLKSSYDETRIVCDQTNSYRSER